jgi:HEAT repeat protein
MVIQDELYALRNAQRLSGPDWNRRIQAANLLGEAGSVEAVPELQVVAIEGSHPELVKSAIRALGRIQGEAAIAAVGHVLENSQDEAARRLCVEILLMAFDGGSPAAGQALNAISNRVFAFIANRVRRGDTLARQVIAYIADPETQQFHQPN